MFNLMKNPVDIFLLTSPLTSILAMDLNKESDIPSDTRDGLFPGI